MRTMDKRTGINTEQTLQLKDYLARGEELHDQAIISALLSLARTIIGRRSELISGQVKAGTAAAQPSCR